MEKFIRLFILLSSFLILIALIASKAFKLAFVLVLKSVCVCVCVSDDLLNLKNDG